MINRADVLVVGGGMAGICAALGAAETGKNVILLERSAFVGGNATKSNVGTVCGAYYRSPSGNVLPAGNRFSRHFVKELQHSQGIDRPVNYHNGLFIIPYEWSVLLKFLNEKIARWDNLKVYCQAEVNEVIFNHKKITGARAKVGNASATFETEAVVDSSGNGIISQLAGLENISSGQYQAATQVFRISGVQSASEFSLNMAIKKNMMLLISEMKWPGSFKVMSVVPGSLRHGKVDIKLTLPDVITDDAPRNALLFTKAKDYINEIFPFLKENIESLRNSRIEKIFPEPGIRTLRRSKGIYTLTENDVLSCKKDLRGVAAGVWPIEYWKNDGQVDMVYFNEEDSYWIPWGCLQSGEVENLFFAGKNISATDRAVASARVIGTCIQTGYAAGKLATCRCGKERGKMTRILHDELKETDREYI